jgi:hypothetical protein
VSQKINRPHFSSSDILAPYCAISLVRGDICGEAWSVWPVSAWMRIDFPTPALPKHKTLCVSSCGADEEEEFILVEKKSFSRSNGWYNFFEFANVRRREKKKPKKK